MIAGAGAGQGEGKGSYSLMGREDTLIFGEIKKVLEMDGNKDCTAAVYMYLIPLNHTLKNA